MITFEVIHRARIECTGDNFAERENAAFAFAPKGVEVDAFSGNAACEPYITGESADRQSLELWAHKVARL